MRSAYAAERVGTTFAGCTPEMRESGIRSDLEASMRSDRPSAGTPEQGLSPTHNLNVAGFHSLVTPRRLKEELPVGPASHAAVLEGRESVKAILEGRDERFLALVGPCSIHDVHAAEEYARRLASVRADLSDRMVIIMRTYFEKPRTTVGWKGLINDPRLDGSFDIERGLRLARGLLLGITALGLPAGTEMLDPITPQYIDDLVSWAAIGARTIESQTHRQMASGLSMPVGYKNSTDGQLRPALEAFQAALKPHRFLGIDEDGLTSVVVTRGNPAGHVILRGGREAPNYDSHRIAEAVTEMTAAGLPPRIMVDCSHANSGKRHERQHVVWSSVIEQRTAGNRALIGAMLESNLEEGRQDLPADPSLLRYGVSVTDACIGWEETVGLLRHAHARLG
jgi:3-deoxy-7-phosphoheptulonate synthase